MKFSLETKIAGRFLFGIRGKSINMIIVSWFKGSELSFAQVTMICLEKCVQNMYFLFEKTVYVFEYAESCKCENLSRKRVKI